MNVTLQELARRCLERAPGQVQWHPSAYGAHVVAHFVESDGFKRVTSTEIICETREAGAREARRLAAALTDPLFCLALATADKAARQP